MGRRAIAVAAGLDRGRLAAALAGAAALRSAGDWFVAASAVEEAAVLLRRTLDGHHAARPLDPGMGHQSWRAVLHGPLALAELAEADLIAAGAVVREGSVVRRPEFAPGSSASARAAQDRVLGALRAAGAEPPSVAELAAAYPDADVPAVLRLLARTGTVTPVAPDRYYATEALVAERDRLVSALTDAGTATPAQLRERLGRSRKWLIPFLEWADREGVTIRDGDGRRLHPRMGA
jgi:selenocysteine-specific elongation factor